MHTRRYQQQSLFCSDFFLFSSYVALFPHLLIQKTRRTLRRAFFIILFYLLCVIGGGLSYCEDCNSGFTRYAVVRGDAKKYIRGHLFSAALGGCASMLGGMALYELLMIFTLWPIKGSFYAMFSQNHAYFIQNIWNALLLSLLGAVLAGLAMTVTACIPNIFVGTAMPILIYYMVICLSNKYAPLELGPILPAWVYFGNAEFLGGGIWQMLYALAYTGCIYFVLWKIAARQIIRRMENA